jgi:hypothetical protein
LAASLRYGALASFVCGVWQYALEEARDYGAGRNKRIMEEQRARIRESIALRKFEQEQDEDFTISNMTPIPRLPISVRHSTDTGPIDIRYRTMDEHGQVHDPTHYGEDVKNWFSKTFPIPDWAYVSKRGEAERLLDEEIEELELQIARSKIKFAPS